MRPISQRFGLLGLAAVLSASFTAGCKRQPAQQAPAGPPPAAVTFAHPIKRQIVEWDEYNGRLAAVEDVEVRARVGGFLKEVKFEEGSLVKAGDLLFVIDPDPFQAAYDQAKAEVQRAAAQLEYNTAEFNRLSGLRNENAISVKEFEDAKLNQAQGQAAVAAADAAMRAAELNLQYTKVVAPISGRIGRRIITQGNLITGGATQSTLLTTIVSLDPIYCYINADEKSVLKYQKLSREKERASARDSQIVAWMALSDEDGFPHEGTIDFVNNTLDPTTGTLNARGIFANPGGTLTPGLFAKMRLPGSALYDAVLVPDEAVQTDQNQKFVYTIDEKNMAAYRRVELGPIYEGFRVVRKGLAPEDRVVINGLTLLRPGAPTNPKEEKLKEPPVPRDPRQPASNPIAHTPTTAPTSVPTTSIGVSQ